METDSATLRPVLAGSRTAVAHADGLLPPASSAAPASITHFPGLRLLLQLLNALVRVVNGFLNGLNGLRPLAHC